ncbi:MAG: hypothetical protein ABFC73_09530 [Clostridiaceae bacterium]
MKQLVEVFENAGEDYKPLVDYNGWRVAILNDAPKFRRENTTFLERHNETDEVFILLEGDCALYIGDGKDGAGVISLVPMEKRKLYNVKKGVWHNLTVVPGTSLLIVENADTSERNSDYFPVTSELLPKA